MRVLPLFLSLALAVAALPADAQWRWRDKSGRVTASDLPPPRDIPDKDILQRPDLRRQQGAAATSAPASGVVVLPASGPGSARPVDRELEAKKRAAEQEQQAKTKADDERVAAQRADNCRRARSQLAALDSGTRIARTNDKGEREILDDKARADETRRANEAIGANCS